jgi:hypothetical protein
MPDDDQMDRRKQIQNIMTDPNLSQSDKSRAIQCIMDGRRRSMSSVGTHSIGSYSSSNHNNCYASSMADLAAHAHEYYSDEEGEDAGMTMDLAPDNIACYGCDHNDERSVDSSVTQTSYRSQSSSQQLRRAEATNSSLLQHSNFPGGASYRQIHGRSKSLTDWGAADRAVAAASTSIFNNPAQISKLMEQSRPKCTHYDRNCTIVAPCCGLAFGCRICHDECPGLPKPLSQRKAADDDQSVAHDGKGNHKHQQGPERKERRHSMPTDFEEAEAHHNINRFAIREVICRNCYARQSSKSYVVLRWMLLLCRGQGLLNRRGLTHSLSFSSGAGF